MDKQVDSYHIILFPEFSNTFQIKIKPTQIQWESGLDACVVSTHTQHQQKMTNSQNRKKFNPYRETGDSSRYTSFQSQKTHFSISQYLHSFPIDEERRFCRKKTMNHYANISVVVFKTNTIIVSLLGYFLQSCRIVTRKRMHSI